MPELPEVETVCRGLQKQLPGRSIAAVAVYRPASVGHPAVPVFKRRLVGHCIVAVRRRGKFIVIELDENAYLVVHLRMSGRLLLRSGSVAREDHVRLRITLTDGGELIFEDMRVFGRLWYVSGQENLEEVVSGLSSLGVEPLSQLTGQYLQSAFAKKVQPVKTALLDQTIIAGIGNIYADESLHLAGINPSVPAGSLSLPQLDNLSEKIQKVLAQAIALGGSTLRNYTDSSGVNGNYQGNAFVYGRTGQPCRGCAALIERVKIGGRSSHFCACCQPINGRKRR